MPIRPTTKSAISAGHDSGLAMANVGLATARKVPRQLHHWACASSGGQHRVVKLRSRWRLEGRKDTMWTTNFLAVQKLEFLWEVEGPGNARVVHVSAYMHKADIF